jgi:hypothetical protein
MPAARLRKRYDMAGPLRHGTFQMMIGKSRQDNLLKVTARDNRLLAVMRQIPDLTINTVVYLIDICDMIPKMTEYFSYRRKQ